MVENGDAGRLEWAAVSKFSWAASIGTGASAKVVKHAGNLFDDSSGWLRPPVPVKTAGRALV